MDDNQIARKAIDDAMREEFARADLTEITTIACMEADFPGFFEDDEFDDCVECGCRVRYRPYMPDLPKVCMGCVALIAAGAA